MQCRCGAIRHAMQTYGLGFDGRQWYHVHLKLKLLEFGIFHEYRVSVENAAGQGGGWAVFEFAQCGAALLSSYLIIMKFQYST